MPSADLWVQYSLVAIVLLAAGLISRGFYKMWRDFLAWMDKQTAAQLEERKQQDEKRDQERERQREWEAKQNAIRDERWQAFISGIQANAAMNDARTAELLEKMVYEIKTLTSSLNDHDTYVRAVGVGERPTQPLRKRL